MYTVIFVVVYNSDGGVILMMYRHQLTKIGSHFLVFFFTLMIRSFWRSFIILAMFCVRVFVCVVWLLFLDKHTKIYTFKWCFVFQWKRSYLRSNSIFQFWMWICVLGKISAPIQQQQKNSESPTRIYAFCALDFIDIYSCHDKVQNETHKK